MPYRTVAGDTCTTYTQSTCPAGHWGNAATSKCVSCDGSAGKVPNGVVGATTEAGACKQAAFGIVGTGVEIGDASSGTLVADEQCVTDGVGNHGAGEQATMTAITAGMLYSTGTFETYNSPHSTYLTVQGNKYYGTTPPSNIVLAAGESFTWKSGSNSGIVKAGFTLCLCDTSVPYQTFANSACTTYTQTTCPSNHWGNVATSTCFPCGVGGTSPAGSTSASACAGTANAPTSAPTSTPTSEVRFSCRHWQCHCRVT